MISRVIVVSGEEAQTRAPSALASVGLAAVIVPRIVHLPDALTRTPTSGILLEISTMMRASDDEKHILRELPKSFPLAKFRMAGDSLITAGVTLESFAASCRNFRPRVMRATDRSVQLLPVFLSDESTFADPEKAITLNSSEGGCWVYTTRPWKVGDRVWLRYHVDASVVSAIVRSTISWGTPHKMPGIGLEFERETGQE